MCVVGLCCVIVNCPLSLLVFFVSVSRACGFRYDYDIEKGVQAQSQFPNTRSGGMCTSIFYNKMLIYNPD